MAKRFEQYQDMIARLYPTDNYEDENGKRILSRPITFCVTNSCNLACTYCLPAGTQIKMADFSSKAIEDIIEGDEILGFEEYSKEKGKHTKLQKGTVEKLYRRKSPTITVVFENGEELTLTKNHKVLVRRNASCQEYDYRAAGNLKIGQTVYGLPYFDVEENFEFVEDYDYIAGYIIAMMQGGGCFHHYPDNPKNKYVCRLAVKDIEITERMKRYLSIVGIRWGSYQFLISQKENAYTEALTFNNKASYEILINMIDKNFNFNNNLNYYKGYLAGLYDDEGHIDKDSSVIRIANTDKAIVSEVENALKALGIPYKTTLAHQTVNLKDLWQVRILGGKSNKYSYKFLRHINNAVTRKKFGSFYNNAILKRMKIADIKENAEEVDVYNIGTTCRTYIANNIAVHNCYEHHKGDSFMKFETAKKFIDLLLSGDKGMSEYINPEISPHVVIEFIGGEPFLAIDLMDEIMNYWMDRTTELMHPWADKFMISICSNGTLYFDPRVQKFLEKHKNHMSFSVTVDGNKELHDACRVYKGTNKGCYDIAMAAAEDWMSRGNYMGSKVTLAPENLQYMYDAIMHMVDKGYYEILGNCVYEAEWTNEQALMFYEQGKKLADEFLRRNMDFDRDYYCSLFESEYFHPKDECDIQNWCWGKGTPVLTVDGYKPIEEIKIGDMVYTEDGSIQPVINTMSHMADNVVNISASGVFGMTCTDDHKLFTVPFDYTDNKGKRHYKEYGKHAVKDIGNKDLIKLFQLTTGNVICDTDLTYVVGRYIGDGWHSTTGYKICCSFEEEQELREKLDKANIEYSVDDYPTVKQFNLFKKNTELLDILSRCGKCASEKHLPPECFGWSKESLQALLDGYIDADGSLNNDKQYRFNSVSKRLVQELMVVLRTLGFTPTCCIDKREGESEILGRKVHIKDRYCGYYYEDPSRAKYVQENEDGMWTYGLKVTEAEPQIVYNITVATNHSYVAGGIVSANCGSDASMIACDWDGEIYPCIRYMEMSLGDSQPKFPIGNVDDGIMQTKEHAERVKCLSCLNRRSQSTDECFYCPIAEGCSYCNGWQYELYGTPNKRCTRICPMHKARALFNYYFWNKYYLSNGIDKYMEIHIPEEWALEIVSKEEFDMLKELEREAKAKCDEHVIEL